MHEIDGIFALYKTKYVKEEISADQLYAELNRRTIVLFGAGSAGVGFLLALQKFGIKPVAFLDNDPAKQGGILEALPIETPLSYNQKIRGDVLVILCINTDGKRFNNNWQSSFRTGNPDSLVESLHQMGYVHIVYYSHFWRCYSLFSGEDFPLPSASDVPAILKNKELILQAYSFFEESLSRDIFLKYLSFRLLHRGVSIPTSPFEKKYFNHSFMHLSDKECFVDGGAYTGNTMTNFMKSTSGKYLAYHGIEPDPTLFEKLNMETQNVDPVLKKDIFIYENALFSESRILPLYVMGGPGTLVHKKGSNTVKSITLDTMEFIYKPTYVKLNIEGCEQAAIRGGWQIISECHPVLSIRLLKIRDFWEIPLLIKQIYEGYTLYLRSYMGYLDFFLYAVLE
jgi:FkbM family methyltransferase